ncbi:DUF3613 domain-containing protein [Achromobacter marplatensis]|uniref:DUF3613 domain-containing protein n=1 Tax=Achromobacter marplatensis TaxID=470868 RepID=A0AA43B0M2_9BURK|nr:DUF3613 domain-containing protein [Achromobacter marplatensis]MDH2050960.1 DUF3613 domain-containing protein [Achromobacter marplatensis]
MSQARMLRSFSLALTVAAFAPLSAQAQSNTPLTGTMSNGAAASAAQPVPAATLPDRPVVQQVPSSLPQPGAAAAQPAPVQASPQAATAAEGREDFGDVTRGLLAAQADGRRAGGALPILGPVSTAAWNRYVDSFTHPIPEWFQKRVETKNTN